MASVRLTAYLHADGFVSHYEVEARSPTHGLIAFRAQGSEGSWTHDAHYVETEAHFRQLITRALQELQDDREAHGPYEGPPQG